MERCGVQSGGSEKARTLGDRTGDRRSRRASDPLRHDVRLVAVAGDDQPRAAKFRHCLDLDRQATGTGAHFLLTSGPLHARDFLLDPSLAVAHTALRIAGRWQGAAHECEPEPWPTGESAPDLHGTPAGPVRTETAPAKSGLPIEGVSEDGVSSLSRWDWRPDDDAGRSGMRCGSGKTFARNAAEWDSMARVISALRIGGITEVVGLAGLEPAPHGLGKRVGTCCGVGETHRATGTADEMAEAGHGEVARCPRASLRSLDCILIMTSPCTPRRWTRVRGLSSGFRGFTEKSCEKLTQIGIVLAVMSARIPAPSRAPGDR